MSGRGPSASSRAAVPDDDLVRFVADRDVDAFEELHRRHAAAVLALCRSLCNDAELAAEATHVAFLKLWLGASALLAEDRPRGDGRLRAWLVTVAHRAALDRQRRKRVATVPLSHAHDRATASPGPDAQAVVADDAQRVRAALRELPDEQRHAIELAFFGGLSQSEIASVTGEPLGTVKGRIRLGMRRLRAAMAAEAGT